MEVLICLQTIMYIRNTAMIPSTRWKPLAHVDYPRYAAEIKRMQDLYGGQLTIKMGMEFEVQRNLREANRVQFHQIAIILIPTR